MQHKLELFPSCSTAHALFCHVQNVPALHSVALQGSMVAALLTANKAVHPYGISKMKTRSLCAEIIFNLSPNNISHALKRFGILDSDTEILIVLIGEKERPINLEDIISQVEGQQVPIYIYICEVNEGCGEI
uniref:TP53RK binding protein n=1 Tax=Crocodylus porosus TaxID=8502 RepID=A0A7M4EUG4_CROPO